MDQMPPLRASGSVHYCVGPEDVLRAIERAKRYPSGSLWIDGGSVWRRNDNDDLRSVCDVGTGYWLAYRVGVITMRLLAHAGGLPEAALAEGCGSAEALLQEVTRE
jgi:hypothetical protein